MSYTITAYTRRQAKKLGVKVKLSTRKGKKIDVFNKDGKKLASVGALGYGGVKSSVVPFTSNSVTCTSPLNELNL